MDKKDAFLGKGWGFPPTFFANGAEVEMVSDEKDILQSLNILLSTTLGERSLFSSYGSDLNRFMFEEADQGMVNGIQSMVQDAILNNESRIEVTTVDVAVSDSTDGLVMISIEYLIRTTNTRYNLVYPFYLQEASI
ncbi:MAG: GPW/gp25 family protein [Fluviicola sp.]|nr:GPW/gp25 family protein [Fluviicola sp.]